MGNSRLQLGMENIVGYYKFLKDNFFKDIEISRLSWRLSYEPRIRVFECPFIYSWPNVNSDLVYPRFLIFFKTNLLLLSYRTNSTISLLKFKTLPPTTSQLFLVSLFIVINFELFVSKCCAFTGTHVLLNAPFLFIRILCMYYSSF